MERSADRQLPGGREAPRVTPLVATSNGLRVSSVVRSVSDESALERQARRVRGAVRLPRVFPLIARCAIRRAGGRGHRQRRAEARCSVIRAIRADGGTREHSVALRERGQESRAGAKPGQHTSASALYTVPHIFESPLEEIYR